MGMSLKIVYNEINMKNENYSTSQTVSYAMRMTAAAILSSISPLKLTTTPEVY